MITSAPRGVPAVGGDRVGESCHHQRGEHALCTQLAWTPDITRRDRVWCTIRAITAGCINFNQWSSTLGASMAGDQWMSADRSYGGATFQWLLPPFGNTQAFAPRISATNYTPGITVYGRDFYIEDVGAQ